MSSQHTSDGTGTKESGSIDPERLAQRLIGNSPAMQRVRERVRGLAPLRVNVLASGEDGTGRDRVIETLHELTEPETVPLIRIRCGDAEPGELLSRRGNVYLDEIDRLDLDLQAHWYGQLSETKGTRRFFASATRDLDSLAQRGRFHRGLARELVRFRVVVPPLRERAKDIPELVEHFLPALAEPLGRSEVRMTAAALSALQRYGWPGNVRELRETLEKLIAFSASKVVTKGHVEELLAETWDGVSSARERRDREQRQELVDLLAACGGNLAEVARRMGLSRGAVIYRAQKHGLLPKSGVQRGAPPLI